jgi:hypothetical protein
MSGKKPPYPFQVRGPRVMHGAGALAAQARTLGPVQAAIGSANAVGEHNARMADLAALVLRCQIAEQRVQRANAVISAFEVQMQQLSAEHPARKLGEQIVATFSEALK